MNQKTLSHMPYPPARLKALPLRERPTERIKDNGARSVSLTELLAALIGGARQLEIAETLITRYQTIRNISIASIHEMATIKGLGISSAVRLKAALELGKRLQVEAPESRPQITSPADAANLVMAEMSVLEREELRVMLLDTRNRVTATHTLYVGSLNTNLVRVGELFTDAIRQLACAIIIVHNHPSGDPMPSPEDVRLTEMIVQAGKLLDIELLDHLIIGHGRFVSLKERGLGF